ncbi:hypothetical protein CGMCC3_g17451 [Colletotrichum fructicola]|uniref:Uncharacterized protein n=1 Tax=Colletotrichum fructicola (strain Nara gc5) TaxID=1213859 RepID=A0A7J6IPP2_COLFN|nr:uncharacterized protein CGMCC3_g17451 [Colletotrichum fructicola]KAE9566394.1 hypothetical protein CGMCC3_g17451 [Colletotrichum fructicola]KAF4418881.1 hypothetical protein CFRS1_v015311 [Colletotrichum fructicola]KAF4478245.1 hypothetical protein CGGC5_v013130 [Colletotrichum fructicola Nara gc5]KAF4882360.1 hypothetical protein CGCFRS4_v014639 [Colletotrichum fructicola]
MHFNPTHILFLAALASAVPTEMGSMEPRSPAGSELDARAAGKWECIASAIVAFIWKSDAELNLTTHARGTQSLPKHL